MWPVKGIRQRKRRSERVHGIQETTTTKNTNKKRPPKKICRINIRKKWLQMIDQMKEQEEMLSTNKQKQNEKSRNASIRALLNIPAYPGRSALSNVMKYCCPTTRPVILCQTDAPRPCVNGESQRHRKSPYECKASNSSIMAMLGSTTHTHTPCNCAFTHLEHKVKATISCHVEPAPGSVPRSRDDNASCSTTPPAWCPVCAYACVIGTRVRVHVTVSVLKCACVRVCERRHASRDQIDHHAQHQLSHRWWCTCATCGSMMRVCRCGMDTPSNNAVKIEVCCVLCARACMRSRVGQHSASIDVMRRGEQQGLEQHGQGIQG